MSHKHCKHKKIKYCPVCNVVYCVCGAEWFSHWATTSANTFFTWTANEPEVYKVSDGKPITHHKHKVKNG